MLRKVKNSKELNKIEELITRDVLVLSNVILDAKKLTRDLINDLDIDKVEDYLINNFEFIVFNSVFKDCEKNIVLINNNLKIESGNLNIIEIKKLKMKNDRILRELTN